MKCDNLMYICCMEKMEDNILKSDRAYNFGAMAIGEHIFLDKAKARYMIFSSLRSYNKTYGTEIRIRTQKDGEGVKVYRIS